MAGRNIPLGWHPWTTNEHFADQCDTWTLDARYAWKKCWCIVRLKTLSSGSLIPTLRTNICFCLQGRSTASSEVVVEVKRLYYSRNPAKSYSCYCNFISCERVLSHYYSVRCWRTVCYCALRKGCFKLIPTSEELRYVNVLLCLTEGLLLNFSASCLEASALPYTYDPYWPFCLQVPAFFCLLIAMISHLCTPKFIFPLLYTAPSVPKCPPLPKSLRPIRM